MQIDKKNRTDLKGYFVTNAIPTQGQFAELIDGMLNQVDDGIAKPAGNPLCIEAVGGTTGAKKLINFYEDFADAKPSWVLSLGGGTSPGSVRSGFNVQDGAGNTRLFIDRGTGNVGIGTAEPGDAKLDVRGIVRAEMMAILSATSDRKAPATTLHVATGSDSGGSSANSGYVILGDADGTHLSLDNNEIMAKKNGTTVSDLSLNWDGGDVCLGHNGKFTVHDGGNLTLAGDGNMGLGTTNPQMRLHIKWDSRTQNGIRLESATTHWDIKIQGDDVNDADLLFVYDDGTNLNNWASAWVEPNGGVNSGSDIRLKKGVSSLAAGEVLEKVMRLRPVSFAWKNDAQNRRVIGMIANEVEEVFPEIVSTKRDLKGLSYGVMGVLAISAVQELQRRTSELARRIEALEARA